MKIDNPLFHDFSSILGIFNKGTLITVFKKKISLKKTIEFYQLKLFNLNINLKPILGTWTYWSNLNIYTVFQIIKQVPTFFLSNS